MRGKIRGNTTAISETITVRWYLDYRGGVNASARHLNIEKALFFAAEIKKKTDWASLDGDVSETLSFFHRQGENSKLEIKKREEAGIGGNDGAELDG